MNGRSSHSATSSKMLENTCQLPFAAPVPEFSRRTSHGRGIETAAQMGSEGKSRTQATAHGFGKTFPKGLCVLFISSLIEALTKDRATNKILLARRAR